MGLYGLPPKAVRPFPDCALIHTELRKPGVTVGQEIQGDDLAQNLEDLPLRSEIWTRR
jgi:hypothetical protein